MKDCKDCANYITETRCFSMNAKRDYRTKFCFMTVQEAMDAERAIVQYIEKQQSTKNIGIVPAATKLAWKSAKITAVARIRELENK